MAEYSLGVITTGGGGPVRATANEVDPTKAVWANSYRVQHYQSTNTGRGWVGDASMDISTGASVFGFLPEIGAAQLYSSPAPQDRQNPYNMRDIYIDADNGSDEFLVTYLQV